MAGTPHSSDARDTAGGRGQQIWTRWAIALAIAAFVLWQVVSCYGLSGAEPPPVTPYAVSKDLAQEMRQRVMEAKSTPGPFAITLTDQELTSYVVTWLQSGPGTFPARDMQIEFGEGYAEIWITFIDIAPSDIPVYVRASVRAVDGHAVLDISQATGASIQIPGAMRELVAQVLTETLADLELGLRFERATIEPGRLILEGQITGAVPDLP